jgi:hypothetical protein
MADYSLIHERISKGRGKAALHVGQPFNVYRLSSSGLGLTQVCSDLPCLLRKAPPDSIEQRTFPGQFFELVLDLLSFTGFPKLEIGDLLIEDQSAAYSQPEVDLVVQDADPATVGFGLSVLQSWQPCYMLTLARPVHKFVGVRLELLCQVRRGTWPESADSGPSVGSEAGLNWQQQGENAEQILALLPSGEGLAFVNLNTIYPLGDNLVQLVPFQLEQALLRGRPAFDLPMDYLIGKWHYACPSHWPGLRVTENDYIIRPDGRRLRVHTAMESHIGSVLSQGFAELLQS